VAPVFFARFSSRMETVMCTRHPFHAVAVFAASVAASAMAAPLSPAAGDRVVQSAAMVASGIQDAIASDETAAAENLRRFVDTEDAFRLYHRDNQLLVAITTRRSVPLADRKIGEQQAAEIARNVLQQRFSHLLESDEVSWASIGERFAWSLWNPTRSPTAPVVGAAMWSAAPDGSRPCLSATRASGRMAGPPLSPAPAANNLAGCSSSGTLAIVGCAAACRGVLSPLQPEPVAAPPR